MRAQQANPFHLPGSIMQIAVWSSLSADELQCLSLMADEKKKQWTSEVNEWETYPHPHSVSMFMCSKSLSLKATGVQVSTTTNKAKCISIW